MRTVVVAKEFSRHPAGRTEDDGPFSGAAFRKRFLEPALRNGEEIVVEFDGTRGAGSSFLEEAFGGLVRNGFGKDQILRLVTVHHSTNPTVKREVLDYISQA